MALTLAVALLGGILEDTDLLALAILHDGGVHRSALHGGSAEGGLVAIQNGQHLVEHHALTGLGLQLLDEQDVALAHLILLAAGNNDCLHLFQLLHYGLALLGGGLFTPLVHLNAQMSHSKRLCYFISTPALCQ